MPYNFRRIIGTPLEPGRNWIRQDCRSSSSCGKGLVLCRLPRQKYGSPTNGLASAFVAIAKVAASMLFHPPALSTRWSASWYIFFTFVLMAKPINEGLQNERHEKDACDQNQKPLGKEWL
ncbi:MAG TPA: hypothetical protein PKA41_01700 [Verrucomicrobiota bacterium]|nr:hypothetical protein [Verrucomicrobiota bacterium]